MTWHLTLACDGTRASGHCLGSEQYRGQSDVIEARAVAIRDGWRLLDDGRILCPSPDHEEDPGRPAADPTEPR